MLQRSELQACSVLIGLIDGLCRLVIEDRASTHFGQRPTCVTDQVSPRESADSLETDYLAFPR